MDADDAHGHPEEDAKEEHERLLQSSASTEGSRMLWNGTQVADTPSRADLPGRYSSPSHTLCSVDCSHLLSEELSTIN